MGGEDDGVEQIGEGDRRMGREWKERRGNQRDEMRGQKRRAILISLLCESLCGFNGLSFTAGANSAVLRKDTVLSTSWIQVNAPLAFGQFSSLHRSTWATGAIGLQWDQ